MVGMEKYEMKIKISFFSQNLDLISSSTFSILDSWWMEWLIAEKKIRYEER